MPLSAVPELAPILDRPAPVYWLAMAYLLQAAARSTLGDSAAAEHALERALDLAEPDGAVMPFLLHPVPDLLDRHTRHRTAHAALLAEIQSLLAGRARPSAPSPRPLLEPLSGSELRVLRYLPTNLTAPEVARELYVSPHTVKTHMRHIYAKLAAHRRAEAVERARALGLLAPSTASRTRSAKTATP